MIIPVRKGRSVSRPQACDNVFSRIAPLVITASLCSVVPAHAQTFTWNGGGSNNNWSTGANWGGTAPATNANANIQFSGSTRLSSLIDATYAINSLTFASGAGAFTLSGSALTIGAGGITQSSATNLQTINNAGIALSANQTWTVAAGGLSVVAPITGASSLIVTGAGTLILSGTNSYTGGTTVTSGILRITSDRGLGAVPGSASTSLTLNAGTLQWGNTFNLNSKRGISLGASGGTINTNGFNGTIAGVISGSGSLTKSGTGTLTLTGTNTYTGGTVFNAGIINVSSDSALGAVPGSAATNLTFNGGTLQWGNNFTVNANRNITLGASGGTFDTNGFNGTLAGVISGTGALTKTGTGTLTLSGVNTYSGGTTVNNGTLAIAADSALGATNSTLTLNGGTLQMTSAVSLVATRPVSLGTSGGTVDTGSFAGSIGGVISGIGSLTKTGSGTLTLSGTNTYTGGTFLNGGAVIVSADAGLGTAPTPSAATNLTFNGGTLRWGAAFNPSSRRNITLNSAGGTFDTNGFAATVPGVISGAGTLTKLGAGTLTLSGTNTYTGGTVLGSAGSPGTAGTLSISNDLNLGAIPSTASTNLTLNGNTLLVNSAITINAARNIALGSGNATINTNTGVNSVTIAGSITGSGSFTKAGVGTLILSGTNTYTGGTTINEGTLRVSADTALGATPGAFSASNLTFTGGTLLIGAAFTLNANRGITLGTGGGTINTNTFSTTISQAITGTGSLTKTGTGTLTLSGTNTYTGGTIVSGGTLLTTAAGINASGVSNGTVVVNSGGTLSNSASINQTFLNLVSNSSTGVVALGTASSNNLDFSNATGANLPSVSLGASSNSTYTGTITPYNGVYRLGGGGATLTLSGTNALTNATSLVVGLNGTSSGTVVLSGANNYTGGTTVNGGVLSYAGASNVGYTGVPATLVTVNSGGTASNSTAISQSFLNTIATTSAGVIALGATSSNALDFSSFSAASLGASSNATYSGILTPNGGVYRLGGGGATLTVSSNLTGSNSLLISTNGTSAGNVTLTGTGNTYSGGTTINSGSLIVTADSQLGAVPASFSANNITFNGSTGTLQFNSSFNLNANRGITINSGSTGTINTNTGVTTTISQTIAGTGANANLIKSGAGTLILSNASNSFTSTTVNQNSGILQFDSLTAIGGTGANVTVNSGSTVALNYQFDQNTLNRFVSTSAGVIALATNNSNPLDFSSTGANLTAASLGATGTSTYSGTLTPNGTTYRLGGGGGTLTVSSNLTGSNALTVSTNSTTPVGTVILFGTNTYTGATTLSQGTLRAGVANAFGTNSAITQSTTVATTLDLAGFNTSLGSLAGGSSTLSSLTLGSNAAQVLTIGGNNTSTSYAGPISGSGNLVKSGTGTQTLSGTNTYSGTTTINAGVLLFNAVTSIGGAGASMTVNSGGVAAAGYAMDQAFLGRIASGSTGVVALRANSSNNLDFSSATGANLTNTSLGTTGTFTYNGTLTPNANTYRLGGGGGTLTVSSTLSGANSLIMDGNGTTAGTVILGAANTYTGGTTVNSGTLQAGIANAIGNNSAVTLASGTTLDLNGFNMSLGSLAGTGTLRFGTTTAGNPLTNTLTIGGDNSNTTFTGNMTVVGGTGGSLLKTGTGTLELSGTNTYTSGTTVSQGILRFNQAASIGTGSLTINYGGTAAVGYALDQTLLNRVTTGSAGVIALAANSSNTLDFSNATGANLPSLSLGASGNFTFSGNINPYGTNYRLGGGGGVLTMSQPLADGENGATGIIVDVNGTTPGTVVLGAINSYTGSTTVNAGILQISSDANLGTVPSSPTPGNVTLNGGTLQASANVTLSVNRGFQLGTSGGTIDTQANNVTVPAIVAGPGTLTKTGSGTLTLPGVNTYTSGTIVNGGTLAVSADSGLGGVPSSPTTNLTLNGGTLQWGSGFTANANRNITLGATGGTFDTNGFNGTVAGAVSGSGGFTKSGAGTLTLSGAYTASGNVNVNTGTLVLPNSASSSNINVASGAALNAGGSVGALTLASGSTIAPQSSSGAAIGLLNATTMTIADGSILNFDLGPSSTSDRIALSGIFDYNPSSSGTIGFAFDVPSFSTDLVGHTFTLVTFATNPTNGSPANVSKFTASPRGNLQNIQGHFNLLMADGGQPGVLTYTVTGAGIIPEPGTLGLLGVSGLVFSLVGLHKRKH